ncbi:unnamed protein product, partial [Medioppia subpectinata]
MFYLWMTLILMYIMAVECKPKIIPCSNHNRKQEVRVTPCTTNPCILTKGTTGTFEVVFEAPDDSQRLTAQMSAIIGGLRLPAPHFDRNVCNGYGVQCPVTRGQEYRYKYVMKVLAEYP